LLCVARGPAPVVLLEAAPAACVPLTFYGPDGGKLAVMQGQTLKRADIPLPGGGEAVYQGSGLAYYRHADWLGSSRLASTPGAQEYSIAAYAVDPNNPQSWNRYAYVGGTPWRPPTRSGWTNAAGRRTTATACPTRQRRPTKAAGFSTCFTRGSCRSWASTGSARSPPRPRRRPRCPRRRSQRVPRVKEVCFIEPCAALSLGSPVPPQLPTAQLASVLAEMAG